MMLSDLGAEVIKVERIGGEESRTNPPLVRGQSVYFTVYNRGKKSICLDMRGEHGKKIFAGLVQKSDMVLENFRPGTMTSMGFGYEALKRDIILVSVSGFGQYGPYLDLAGSHRSGPDAGSTRGRNPHFAPWDQNLGPLDAPLRPDDGPHSSTNGQALLEQPATTASKASSASA